MAQFGLKGGRGRRRDHPDRAPDRPAAAEYPPLTSEIPVQAGTGPRRSAVPLSVALLNKQSIGGAAAILLCALFFILVIPQINDSIKGEDLTVGVPLAVGEDLQVTPGPGWVLSNSEENDFTALTNSGAQLIITPAKKSTRAIADQIQAMADDIADDPDLSWVVTPPTAFTTTAGDSGATVTAQSKDTATQIWILTDGDVQTTLVLTSPIAVYDGIVDSAGDIASSVKFTAEEVP